MKGRKTGRHKPSLNRSLRNFLPLKEYFIRNRRQVAAGLFCLLLVDLLQLLVPLVIKRVIDSLTFKTATSGALIKYGIVIVAIALVIGLLRYVWRYFLLGHSRKVEEGLRNRLYSHLQSLSPSFYQRTTTGDLMARATNDLNAVRMATGIGMVALTDSVVLGVSAIGFMIYISPSLTLISLLPAPIIVFFTKRLTRRMFTGYERVQKTFSDLTERAREAFAGVRVIKAYSRESWQYKKMEDEGRRYVSENMRLARTIAFFFPMMVILTNIGLAAVIWAGGRLTILGEITTGDFVAFIGYLNLLTWPMMAVGWMTSIVQRGSASMGRINGILDEVPEIRESPKTVDISRIRGDITFKDFSLKYPGKDAFSVKGIDLTIKEGQTVSLVGRVGSGKTTLLQAIPRLLDIPRGTLFVDGEEVTDIPLKKLRESIGFVTQEVIIFSDTIRNNVVFGRADVPEKTLEAVLDAAQIHDEVKAFDKGLDTLLGERGITLSGGQRQRLTIARALLSDPPILILDDALSMVDTRTEERILNRVLEYRKNKTNLIVSHRLSTISRADFIVVLEGGRLVEVGDHKALMGMGNEYARLYERELLAQELEIGVT